MPDFREPINGARFTSEGYLRVTAPEGDLVGGIRVGVANQPLGGWVFGDDASTVSIAASGTSAAPAIDVRAYDRTHATLQIVVTGSGTCKLTATGTRDGVSNAHSFGDIVTGMTASPGSFVVPLNHASLTAYMPYLHFSITETGGASAVTVKAYLAGRGR